MSTDFGPVKCASLSLHELHRTGLQEFNPPPADKGLESKKERIRWYRRYVYEAGALNRLDTMQVQVIDAKVVAKERKKDFEACRISRFRYRTHYFSDSGIIGSKQFVAENYKRFKQLFQSKHEKKPNPTGFKFSPISIIHWKNLTVQIQQSFKYGMNTGS